VQTHRLILELRETPAEHISGTLVDESGHAVDFAGWLGLASALQAAVQPDAPPDADADADQRHH